MRVFVYDTFFVLIIICVYGIICLYTNEEEVLLKLTVFKEKKMLVYVCLKSPVNITKKVKKIPFELANTPHTLRELVTESVKTWLAMYKKRAEISGNPKPLTDEVFDEMREIGKIAFGMHFGKSDISEEKAVETALQAVSDGLVCVFKENEGLFELDKEVEISEGDVFSFVRLTLLSGRMW